MNIISEYLNLPYTKFFLQYWFVLLPMVVVFVFATDYIMSKRERG